jgi:hypothetical protein
MIKIWLAAQSPSDVSNPSFFFYWRCGPTRARASLLMRFLDQTRRTTVGRTPLDEWSARRRDLWQQTTHTTDRHPRARWDSNSQSQQANTHALDRAATWTGHPIKIICHNSVPVSITNKRRSVLFKEIIPTYSGTLRNPKRILYVQVTAHRDNLS